jgi:predicted esterase
MRTGTSSALPLVFLSVACTPSQGAQSRDAPARATAENNLDAQNAEAQEASDAADTTASFDATPRRASGAYGIVVVASTSAPPPLVVYMHGMGAQPEDSCSYFERAVLGEQLRGALVCPRGNMPAALGGAWGGMLAEKRRSYDDALGIARGLAPSGSVAASGGTLMGFSIGAAYALELALAEPGRWTGLVLMSNPMKGLSPVKLKEAGVRRVVFATGEYDGSYPAMMAAASASTAAGLEARFVTLGKVGHRFAKDMETRMVEVLAWVRGG